MKVYGNIEVGDSEQYFVGDENPPDDWKECYCCEGYHPSELSTLIDCRDDRYRWPSRLTGGID